MGIPFTVVSGAVLLMDTNGNTVEMVNSGGYRMKTQSKILGADGVYEADVVIKNLRKALVVDATVSVEQVFGFDDFADSWFFITRAGGIGDTLKIDIAASTTDSSSPDRDIPAYTYTYILTAADAGDEIKLRDNFIASLNADPLFNLHWKASSIKDNAAVHISSKYIGEFGERTGINAFVITTTGTTTYAFQNSDNNILKRRGKQNSGIRDPRDKRLVTIGISGEVQAVPGAVGDLYIQKARNGLGSPSMLVNGNLTPTATTTFTIPADTIKDIFIEEIRFNGQGNGIKFGQFLSQNAILTNGILVEIRSDEQITVLPLIRATEDFKHDFAYGQGSGFQLNIQAGRDDFMASFNFSATFPIRKAGTFVTGDDYIKVYIRDNLTGNLQQLEFAARGFRKEV